MAINGLSGSTLNKLYGLTTAKEKKPLKEAKEPEKKTDKYSEARDRLLDEYLNREPYDFNINTDKLYRQYADMYKKQGEAAMRDTVAQAASKTGGYGSSYGVTAGAQAYQSYLDKLNDIVPELEEIAYDRYTDERKSESENIDMLDSLDSKEYDKYRDSMDDYKDLREYYRKVYEYDNDYEYDMYKVLTDYILSLAKLENSDYHKELDYDIALKKLLYS
ncbi:MAG: hypothetical protein IKU19_09595 [Clostridia bacterium]|nr:hypothetical protein [Clostridia bacterium]